ncbi:diadenosine tetraphosphate hydrolase [archaeon]|nr:diadenosine tetraphosphate hydrolase [archaeon]|tara:strand:- start:675 stop:1133 length:459 start_codon:yes stop_codon:yes gene_type:complete
MPVREKTIGFVVFRKEGSGYRFLLLRHEGSYWNFPKGRAEAGESDLDTARRELLEETGISKIKVHENFRHEYDYDFSSVIEEGKRVKIFKRAIFFLGEVEEGTGDIKISDEHLDYGWFDFKTASRRSFFQEGRDLLKVANRWLSLHYQNKVI